MKQYRYIKSNAFTSGASTGNPAATIIIDEGSLAPEQMLQIAAEHKGFVMESVFCSPSDTAACKLTYYSSECEVDFCGHGTIATMYSLIKDDASLRNRKVLSVETNKKGVISVYNEIDTEDAVYIEAPSPIEHEMNIPTEEIERMLTLHKGSIDQKGRAIRIIDAGLRTLIVPVSKLEDEVSVFPDLASLKAFCEGNDIDIILIYSLQVADASNFAHTRVFAPRFGYLEDPATGSGNSAFANYLLSEKMWDGTPITIEQGGNDRIFNAVKLKTLNGKVLFGGRATTKIQGFYCV
jgi:PhzF family phenazine biosynthesis protein